MKSLLSILVSFILAIQVLLGQNKSQEIYLLDAHSKQGIGFATLVFESSKLAFTSDETGKIQLNYPLSLEHNKIYIQHLSYLPFAANLGSLSDTLYLQVKDNILPTLEINTLSAKQLMLKAIELLSENYNFQDQILAGLYEQKHKENGKYVRLIQAQVQVKLEGYDPKIKLPQEESFYIQALRKSYVYERNGDKHGDHLVDLFAENPLQYLDKWMLNPKNIDLYEWQFLEQDQGSFVVYFQNKNWNDRENLHGKFWINPIDKAIVHLEIHQTPNYKSQEENKSNWKLINGWYEASYTKIGDDYELQTCNKWYNHELRNEMNPKEIDFIVEELFHWEKRNDFNFSQTAKFVKSSNLYATNLKYEQEVWAKVVIDSLISKDLEQKYDLKHQFTFP